MRITVRVQPNSKHPGITMISANAYEIAVAEHPEKGRATTAVRQALAKHLHIPQSRLSLVMGAASRTKVFEIM